jgi:hypothetical protein
MVFLKFRMKKIRSLGEKSRYEHGRPNDEHDFFHKFLLMSPSYQLAHKFITGQQVDLDMINKIHEWDKVINTYSLFGDIFTIPYLEWWDQRGRDIFYVQQADGTYLPLGPIQLLTNKIQIITLREFIKVMRAKQSVYLLEKGRVENWRVAVETAIKSKWTNQLKIDDKKSVSNLEARTALGMLVSKKLKEALYVVENAARGRFPSIEPINSGLSLKDAELQNTLNLQFELNRKNRRERKANGLYVPKSYYLRKILPKWKLEMEKKREIERQIKLKLDSKLYPGT